MLPRAFPLSTSRSFNFGDRLFQVQIFHLPHVLALTMNRILLTLAYKETTLISARPVWALLIINIDVDVYTIVSTFTNRQIIIHIARCLTDG